MFTIRKCIEKDGSLTWLVYKLGVKVREFRNRLDAVAYVLNAR